MFGRNKETSANYVVVARGRAGKKDDKAGLVATYGPMARTQARAAADAAAQAARAYGPVARNQASLAYGGARDRVQPMYQAARIRAVSAAGPRVQKAVDQMGPQIDVARDRVVESWLPKASAAIASAVAANAAARNQVVEMSGRVPDAVAVLKGDAVAKQPKSRGRVWIGLGVVSAVGAGVAALASRRPKEDPWATPSTTSTGTSSTSPSTSSKRLTDRVSGARETVTAAAGSAAHRVADARQAATAKASQVASRGKGGSATSTPAATDTGVTTPAAPKMTTTASDTGAQNVDVLGEVADANAVTSGDPTSEVAGAAHGVKPDVTDGTRTSRNRADETS